MMTKQRQTIYDYFQKHSQMHPTAEQVYAYVKKKEPSIGLATVYRNLKKLVEEGMLRELNLEKQGVHYDLLLHEHDHFICDSCGNIENFVLPILSQVQEEIEEITKAHIITRQLLCHGICSQCLESRKK